LRKFYRDDHDAIAVGVSPVFDDIAVISSATSAARIISSAQNIPEALTGVELGGHSGGTAVLAGVDMDWS
jgi:hypothetical protein